MFFSLSSRRCANAVAFTSAALSTSTSAALSTSTSAALSTRVEKLSLTHAPFIPRCPLGQSWGLKSVKLKPKLGNRAEIFTNYQLPITNYLLKQPEIWVTHRYTRLFIQVKVNHFPARFCNGIWTKLHWQTI